MVSKNQAVVEIELDAGNSDVTFGPLGRKLRGRVDFSSVERPEAPKRHREWGSKAIPGQIIGVDPANGVGYLREPVHQDKTQKERALKQYKLAPEVETFEGINVERWLRAIGRLIESGFAKVLKGTPPEVKPIVEKPTCIELLAASTYAALPDDRTVVADKILADFRR